MFVLSTNHFQLPSASKQTLLTVSVTCVLIRALYWLSQYVYNPYVDKYGNKMPDGPKGLPIVGSFFSMTNYPELTLDFWAKKFGDLYTVWLGSQPFVIVSDPEIAKDLMVTNGANFSNRKNMFIKSQNIFVGRGITATPYNNRWRKHRRIAYSWLNQTAVDSYSPVLDREAAVLIKALYELGKNGAHVNPQPHAGRASLNNMATITFGIRTDSFDHPLVARALKLSREFMNCTGPMSNLIDFVPALQYFPTPLKSRAKKLHKGLVETYGGFITDLDRKIKSGEQVEESLSSHMLAIREEEDLDHLDMTILTSAFMIGGVETTAAIMQWFCALIPAYPEIQKKAQEELDRVVGRDRFPSIEDEKNLPYCHAIIKEIERVRNPFWLGTPHTASEDFTYKGKFIPKDTVVVLNTYSMHNNPERHPEPEKFNPERYINDPLTSAESSALADPKERDHWMFGAGRRICPGMNVAEREIWLAIARMLWAFNMAEIPGKPIDLKEYDGKSGRSPVPFEVTFTPRHENVKTVIDRAIASYPELNGGY